jgi:hypothetical protein
MVKGHRDRNDIDLSGRRYGRTRADIMVPVDRSTDQRTFRTENAVTLFVGDTINGDICPDQPEVYFTDTRVNRRSIIEPS